MARRSGPSRTLFAIALVCAPAGCATLGPEAIARLVRPIEAGLAAPPSTLRARAEAGDAQAQLAWSVAVRRGRGESGADLAGSRTWRRRATASRGFTPLTLYVAGYQGHPSRVSTTLIPRYDVSAVQALAVDACVTLLLAAPATDETTRLLDRGVCGGRANYHRLAELWARADERNPTTP